MILPYKSTNLELLIIKLDNPIGTQARLAVVIRGVSLAFTFTAVAILPMLNDSHFIGEG